MTATANDVRTRMPRTSRTADMTIWRAEVDSTNTVARNLLAGRNLPTHGAGVPIAVVAAGRQTAGRGRLGRQWVARPGESSTVTYATVLPQSVATDPAVNGWLQMTAGLATVDALDAVCAQAGARPLHGDDCRMTLKWPNDVFCHDHKLAGILAELVPLPDRQGAVVGGGGAEGRGGVNGIVSDRDGVAVNDGCGFGIGGEDTGEGPMIGVLFGIGVNLNIPADRLPTALATSLQLHRGPLPAADALLDAIAAHTVEALRSRLTSFIADPRAGAAKLHDETAAVCRTLGRRVEARLTDGTVVRGRAVALNADASLTIIGDDGTSHMVHTGDVGVL